MFHELALISTSSSERILHNSDVRNDSGSDRDS